MAFGQPVRVHGLLMSSAGLPLAGQPIEILTAPDNGSNAFTQAAAVTTGQNGRWTATLPPGPSRIIRAVYPGSPTVLPASGQASTIVPAKIRIHISPRIVPWGSTLRITGQVLGGYVPTNSNLLRLNVGIGKIGHLEGLPKIDPDGRFVIIWKFNPGQGVLHPWFSVGTLSESAFPYAPGTSKRIVITVGEPTPAGPVVKHHHRDGSQAPQAQADKEAQAVMIARHRGEERLHSRWRPAAATSACIGGLGSRNRRVARSGPDRAGAPRSAVGRLAAIARPHRCRRRDRDRRPSPASTAASPRTAPACRPRRRSG